MTTPRNQPTSIGGDYVSGDKGGGDIVRGHKYVYQSPEQKPTFPLDNLPPPNPHFTGRLAQLTAIQKAFRSSRAPVAVTQAIAGLGGVGKTQLALAYAHDQRDAYDLIWLLRADDAAALEEDLRRLGLALHLPLDGLDAATARQRVLSWLNGGRARWLLLYDNADRITPRELHPYLPGGQGHVLITSRRTAWPQAQVVRLDVFTAEEAERFWQRRLVQSFDYTQDEPGRLNQSEADTLAELAEELGYLPLALEHAAAYMETRGKSAAAYLRLYRQRRRELWARAEPPDAYHATITTTWEMAFAHARQAPGAAALLNLCCFLAPEDIPLALITDQAAVLPAELSAIAADELARDDALAALTRYSLLAQADGALTIHRLTQNVARDRMGEERTRVWAEATVNLLYEAYHFDEYDMATWEVAGRLIPHLRAVIELADEWNITTSRVAYLNNEIGFYLNHYGLPEEALPYYKQALSIFQTVHGSEHPATAQSLNNMGVLLDTIGQWEKAKLYYEQALATRKKVLGLDHPDTAQSLNNIGYLLQATGQLEEAQPYYEQALAIRQRVLDPEHPATARSLNNLGTLLQAMGQLVHRGVNN